MRSFKTGGNISKLGQAGFVPQAILEELQRYIAVTVSKSANLLKKRGQGDDFVSLRTQVLFFSFHRKFSNLNFSSSSGFYALPFSLF